MSKTDLLVEGWFPTRELGIESRREAAPIPGQFPKLKTLHVWWARRPLVVSAGAVLGSLMPSWTAELAERFSQHPEIATEKAYHGWFLRLLGVLGDPISADSQVRTAREVGVRVPNPFTYRQAFKNSPTVADLELLHDILKATWGRIPEVLDPTAGGGSIPFEAIRYGLTAHANDLNSIAAAVLRAGVEIPANWGDGLLPDVERWGSRLCDRIGKRIDHFFPDGPDGKVATFLFARTVACPRTDKPVPLAPNWWISKAGGGIAVRLLTERNGAALEEPGFEIVRGKAIDRRATDAGTITRGVAISPWDHLTVDGNYIKAEAQAGRMGSLLYAVAVRTGERREYRAPTPTDLGAIDAAEAELQRLLSGWEAEDVIPDEKRYIGPADRSANYGMLFWRDMFSPRQLLVHGTFVEEYRKLIPEVRDAIPDRDRADAVLSLLALIQGKTVNWNALLSSWDVSRQKMRSVFDRHDFSFKWTHAEFEGARELYPWGLAQITDAYGGIAELLQPGDEGGLMSGPAKWAPRRVSVTQGNAGDLSWMADRSVELVCIDPPYYHNVMYAELADFFYVWEKRTLGRLWPEFFGDELTNKAEEAVANVARFDYAGRRKKELAALDYERKMAAIFAECRRVLSDSGVMTVMFTHKKAEAWDTLGQSLLENGFSIEASWPVHTESQVSLHIARKNAASSTVLLVCRKRPDRDDSKTFFDALESDVRHAARKAYSRMVDVGMEGVDLLLATYGPTLSVLSEHWPVYSSEPGPDGQSRLLRPDEALLVAQEEVVRLRRHRLVAHNVEFDPLTDFWLLAWDMFRAREFLFDGARKLALTVGGVDIDEVSRAKLLKRETGSVVMQTPKDRYRRDPDSALPGVNRERVLFPALVDALHTALYVVDLDGAAAARSWLEQRGLTTDTRMLALVEAAVAAVPRVREKGELTVEEAVLLERLVVAAFPDVTIPEEESLMEQEQLFDA